MASWNSIPLEITYQVVGWIAFVSWTFGFYPQLILNFRRKSVVGLSFDFVVLNLTKHTSYLIYNASLYFSSTIQKQYYEKYGYDEMIPVAANDVAFSTHAVLITLIVLFQILIYDRGSQKVSRIAIAIVIAVWLFAAVCFFIALPRHSWLWLISIFNSIQVFMTVVKYIPQAFMNFKRKSTAGFSIGNILLDFSGGAFMNFKRKSTAGFSIGNILLDFSGGVANYAQMIVQSIDQGSWINFYGNMGKMLLSLVSISFDIIFMCQRFVLYPNKKAQVPPKLIEETTEPLVNTSDHKQSETV